MFVALWRHHLPGPRLSSARDVGIPWARRLQVAASRTIFPRSLLLWVLWMGCVGKGEGVRVKPGAFLLFGVEGIISPAPIEDYRLQNRALTCPSQHGVQSGPVCRLFSMPFCSNFCLAIGRNGFALLP